MLPTAELEHVLRNAWLSAAAGYKSEDHAFYFLSAAHAGIVLLRERADRYWLGTHADVVFVRWESPTVVWIGGAGHCEAFHIRDDTIERVHRETPLDHPDYHNISIGGLGVAEPVRPRRLEVAAGDRIVLANVQLVGDQLIRFIVPRPLDATALWTALRERAANLFQFDRRAAIGIVTV